MPALLTRLDRDPYDYDARRRLVVVCQAAGDHVQAHYQAAWLAWLAPQRYAASSSGAGLLRDRRARDRAAGWERSGPVGAVVAAVSAERSLLDTCLNGAIAQQAGRLRAEVRDSISQVEGAQAGDEHPDPVGRAALARLYLTLDDCLRSENTEASRRARPQALKKAAGLADAVAQSLPKSPGAHRQLAIIRARLAELEDRPELWEMAIEQAKTAQALDPGDQPLTEMIWALLLRAGQWAEANRWRTGGPSAAGKAATPPAG